jgi:hypothetical protein
VRERVSEATASRQVHAYARARRATALHGQDAVLVLVIALAALGALPSALGRALLVAAPVALLWGIVTLHFPSAVTLDDDALVFHRYGRAHRFAWGDVARVRVRRFLVQDRVMVRVTPAPPWRGRYWILESISGYDELLRALHARDAAASVSAARPR